MPFLVIEATLYCPTIVGIVADTVNLTHAFTGEDKSPADKVNPAPTVISSIAPVEAVVLPSTLTEVIVRSEEPTAPDPAAESAVLALAAVDEAVPPLATGNVPVTPVVKGKPVRFVATPDVGVPSKGVTSVGLVAKTAEPVPVSSVNAPSSCAEVKLPSEAAFPTEVTIPVRLALVTTVAALPTEVTPPVKLALVTTVAALPTDVTPPVKLALVTTVAALPTDVTPPVKSALVVTLLAVKAVAVPVMFVPTNADGVPRAGVTKVGLFDSTTFVVPVEDVTPVPPLATARVPARVTTPVVAVDGVNPVVPAENDATTEGAVLVQIVPLEVSKLPDVLGNTELNPVPPLLPMIAALAVTDAAPVPPWATESGVVRPVREVMSPLAPRTAALSAALAAAAVVPAVPPEAIGSAAPRVSEGM